MKRWIARTNLLAMILPAVFSFSFLHGARNVAADSPVYPQSPSDLPVYRSSSTVNAAVPIPRPAPAARPAPDETWMRGLDDVTGTDDVIGSGRIDTPVHDRFRREPIDELPFVHPPNCECCANEIPLTRFRKSFYQGTVLSGGYLSDGGDDALGIAHYDVSVRFAVPLGGMDNIVIAAPSFRQEIIDGPANIDIADNLYNTGVNFTWLRKHNERWRSLVMVAPTIRSDLQSTDEAFRIFGLGLLTYNLIPKKLDASFGVVYLDRDDIPLLPALGFTWTPQPWWKFDLNFPRPRIAYRTDYSAGYSESWVYTGVGLGGNTWAVERANGTNDVLNLRDYQWVFGWENLREGGRGVFAEAGAAFGRSLEYERGGEEVDFDDALFIRLGINL